MIKCDDNSDQNDWKIRQTYTGTKFIVTHCDDAIDSFYDALSSVESKKAKVMEMQITLQLKRLASGLAMSRDSFASEGELPNGKKFYALKRIPIRGYLWQSSKLRLTYYVSHYKYKDHQKLRQKDINKVHANWRKVETCE